MARSGPRRVKAYSREFKLAAVRLSHQRGLQVQAVAAALDIHPFMLSKWRKQFRDGVLRGKVAPLATTPPRREIQRLQELERAHAVLKEEHDLLKKPSGSVPIQDEPLRVHRHAAGPLPGEALVRALPRYARRLLRLATASSERAFGAGPETPPADPASLQVAPWALRQSSRA
jgi:transposase